MSTMFDVNEARSKLAIAQRDFDKMARKQGPERERIAKRMADLNANIKPRSERLTAIKEEVKRLESLLLAPWISDPLNNKIQRINGSEDDWRSDVGWLRIGNWNIHGIYKRVWILDWKGPNGNEGQGLIADHGNSDPTSLIEIYRKAEEVLLNQGWILTKPYST